MAVLLLLVIVTPIMRRSLRSWAFTRWVEGIARPSYTLLGTHESADTWFAIFDAGGSQVAICSKFLTGDHNCRRIRYAVTDTNGRDVSDSAAKDRSDELVLKTSGTAWSVKPMAFYITKKTEIVGSMYPIRTPPDGWIRVVVEVGDNLSTETDTVFDQVLQMSIPAGVISSDDIPGGPAATIP